MLYVVQLCHQVWFEHSTVLPYQYGRKWSLLTTSVILLAESWHITQTMSVLFRYLFETTWMYVYHPTDQETVIPTMLSSWTRNWKDLVHVFPWYLGPTLPLMSTTLPQLREVRIKLYKVEKGLFGNWKVVGICGHQVELRTPHRGLINFTYIVRFLLVDRYWLLVE